MSVLCQILAAEVKIARGEGSDLCVWLPPLCLSKAWRHLTLELRRVLVPVANATSLGIRLPHNWARLRREAASDFVPVEMHRETRRILTTPRGGATAINRRKRQKQLARKAAQASRKAKAMRVAVARMPGAAPGFPVSARTWPVHEALVSDAIQKASRAL